MTEWLTTGQMIDRLKVGEVAEVVSEGVNKGYKLHINQMGNFVAIGDNSTCAVLNKGCINARWKIVPKYVSFEEAMKALKDGKVVKVKFNNSHAVFTKEANIIGWDHKTWDELINGKWTTEE